MMADKWFLSITFALIGVAYSPLAAPAQTSGPNVDDADEKALQAANIKTDNESLLNYLRARVLRENDRVDIDKLIQNLDSEKYNVRVKATADLKQRGRIALPLLRRAINDAPLELVQRAKECINYIETKTATEPTVEVARLLSRRDAPGTIGALFEFLPFAEDPWIEEEVLAALGRLTVRGDKLDPQLVACIEAPVPDRRGAAAYILAQWGDANQRDIVRRMLADPYTYVKSRAAGGLVGKQLLEQMQQTFAADLAAVKGAGMDGQANSLLNFLDKRTPSFEAQKRMKLLVHDLRDKNYPKREKATQALIKEGVPALPFLKAALEDGDVEVVTRAKNSIKTIKSKSSPLVSSAVLRILALAENTPPALDKAGKGPSVNTSKGAQGISVSDAINRLLAYLPFADDEGVEEEAIKALLLLSIRETKVEPALAAAVEDPLPARRAAAALVLGKVGTRAHVESVKKMINDPVAKVRLRVGQGLAAAQEKAAVPVLIDLLGVAPDDWLWQIQELLSRISADSLPSLPVDDGESDHRARMSAAWSQWWKQNAATANLASINRAEAFIGVFTITEYDSVAAAANPILGRVWECGRDGRMRWEIKDLAGPMDAMVLPNGRVLVAESGAGKITERDMRGTVAWTYQSTGPIVALQRLTNGNTFLCTYDRVMEVSPAGHAVATAIKGPQHFIYGAQRMKNGQVTAVTAQGQIIVFDTVGNRDIKTIAIGAPAGWAGIDVLPGGRYLVSLQAQNQIREIDESGKVLWQATFPGAFRAIKLPNGNIVASSMTTRRVAEIDRAGNEVWGVTCKGRPWNVRYR